MTQTSEHSPAEQHHFSEVKAGPFITICALMAFGFGFFAWKAADATWSPRPYGSGAWFVLLLVFLPIWIRVPLMVGIAAELARVAIFHAIHAFDRKPDFSIGPNGVSGVGYFSSEQFSWTDVQSAERDGDELYFFGPAYPKRVLNRIRGERRYIMFTPRWFEGSTDGIVRILKVYRPDIVVGDRSETNNDIPERFRE